MGLLRSYSSSELKDQRNHGQPEYLNRNFFCVPSASSELFYRSAPNHPVRSSKGNLTGLELAKAGTNSVVRRKTLFESADRADFLRNFLFHLKEPGCVAQILWHRYFICRIRRMLPHTRGRRLEASFPWMVGTAPSFNDAASCALSSGCCSL